MSRFAVPVVRSRALSDVSIAYVILNGRWSEDAARTHEGATEGRVFAIVCDNCGSRTVGAQQGRLPDGSWLDICSICRDEVIVRALQQLTQADYERPGTLRQRRIEICRSTGVGCDRIDA